MKLRTFTEFETIFEQFLFEADLEAAKREYNDILTKMGLDVNDKESLHNVADKVSAFLKDPENKKNFLKGLADGNPPADDQVKIETVTLPAHELKPSQDSIYLDQAIRGFVTRIVEHYLKQILDGKHIAPSIFISQDNYIIDGHHRWSAIMALNPNTKMEVTKINLPIFAAIPILNAILKSTGAEAQSMSGDAKTNIWKGLEGEESDYKALILHTLKEAVKPKGSQPHAPQKEFMNAEGSLSTLIDYINKNGIDKIKNEDDLAKHIYDNIREIPLPEKIFPPRNQMPQFPEDKRETDEVIDNIKKGKFDLKKGSDPKAGLYK